MTSTVSPAGGGAIHRSSQIEMRSPDVSDEVVRRTQVSATESGIPRRSRYLPTAS